MKGSVKGKKDNEETGGDRWGRGMDNAISDRNGRTCWEIIVGCFF